MAVWEMLELSILQKCGEIFCDTLTSSNVDVSFQCTFCRKTLMELNTFLQHLQSEHCKPPITAEEVPMKSEAEEGEYTEEDYFETEEVLFEAQDIPILPEDDVSQYVLDKDEEIPIPLEHVMKSAEIEMKCDHNSKASVRSTSRAVKRKRREHNCPHCDRIFKRAWDLKDHLNTHDRPKPFKCKHCPASYFYKSNLTNHMTCHKTCKSPKNRSSQKPKERKLCRFCTKTFTTTTHRRRHERIHTGERPYICESCGKSFASAAELTSHRSCRHLQERNFVCYICDKRFNRRSQLNIHKANVHAARPATHICTICKAAFKRITELKTHINVHKEKVYKCTECNKLFAHHSGLYVHQKIHKKQRDEWLTDSEM
uniref:C2H2-type domain-containing protein n=1 Tax=Glossina austeni TaxID=7395 RepID=A0A1A9VNZ7_GLOAU